MRTYPSGENLLQIMLSTCLSTLLKVVELEIFHIGLFDDIPESLHLFIKYIVWFISSECKALHETSNHNHQTFYLLYMRENDFEKL